MVQQFDVSQANYETSEQWAKSKIRAGARGACVTHQNTSTAEALESQQRAANRQHKTTNKCRRTSPKVTLYERSREPSCLSLELCRGDWTLADRSVPEKRSKLPRPAEAPEPRANFQSDKDYSSIGRTTFMNPKLEIGSLGLLSASLAIAAITRVPQQMRILPSAA